MTVSLVRFRDFNIDPLPSLTSWTNIPVTSIDYGSVVGGTDVLDVADGEGGYIRIDRHGTVVSGVTVSQTLTIVTARGVADPPLPPGALASIDALPTPNYQSRVALGWPQFTMSSSLDSSDFTAFANGGLAPTPTDDIFYSESDFPAPNYGTDYLSNFAVRRWVVDTMQAGGYFYFIPSSFQPLDVSELIVPISWVVPDGIKWHSVGGHFASAGGVTPQILTPGVGWVDIVDGPA